MYRPSFAHYDMIELQQVDSGNSTYALLDINESAIKKCFVTN